MSELQRLHAPADAATQNLYWFWDGPAAPMFDAAADAVRAAQGCRVDGGTFFGSFYESWWHEHTNVAQIALTFRLDGAARVQLVRRDANGVEQIIYDEEWQGRGETAHLPPLDLAAGYAGSRLFPRFVILSETATFSAIAWRSDAPPVRTVKLAVVLCTFNREDDLAAILVALAALRQENSIGDIFVVNHGEAGLAARLHERPALAALSLKVFDQENLGGSGGFTRGLVEALEDGVATHALLLDDDIVVAAPVLRRLAVVAAHMKMDSAIGGAMLDRMRPTWLHNQVTRLDAVRHKVVPVIANGDLALPQHLDQGATPYAADFCGWWCCVLPMAAVRQAGLPLPFFIHYDDVEYGLRLRASGVSSVSWSGIAVWHEPFYAKASAWRRYYDFRNVLFMLAYHDRLEGKAMRREFAWRFAVNIRKHDYAAAWATLQAVADFRAGPSVLAAWNADSHRDLNAAANCWGSSGTVLCFDSEKLARLSATFCRLYATCFFAPRWPLDELRQLGTTAFWRGRLRRR